MSTELSIAPDVDQPTALYRFYDSLGSLLYVGITSNLTSRLSQHEKAQPWWRLVARIDVEHHPERSIASAAEVAAIKAEGPRFNKQHAAGSMVMRSFYVPLPLWEQAKAKTDAEDLNISDVVRELLAEWVKGK